MFSKACEYGIKASIFIALRSQQDVRVSLNDIARGVNSPVAFTAKILQKLTHAKIVDSIKGPTGGYEINEKKAHKVLLSQIVNAIDGNSIYKGCALGFHKCKELKPCPIHHQFKPIREDLRKLLESTSLLTLSQDIDKGMAFLK